MFPEEIDRNLVDLYRAWDAIERSRHRNAILDFDLAPPRQFPHLRHRQEVLTRLENARKELRGETTDLGLLAYSRLTASVAYLRALSGESTAFRPYVKSTLGVEPRMFSEEEIRNQRGLVVDRLRHQYDMGFSKAELSKFHAKFMVYNQEDLRPQFEKFQAKWVPLLLERIPVPLDKYKVNVRFTEEDAYWKNWISGNLSEHEILLRINIHPRQAWYKGFPEMLVIHEYCGHAVQMVNWHRRIEQGELPEFFGILTVHFPDQFLLEGLAESLAFVLPDQQKLEEKSLVSRELQRHYLLVMNNVHIIANEQSAQAALEYGGRNLPFTSMEVLEKEIRDRTRNPLFRTYQYVYGIAKESFLAALSRLDPSQRWDLLRVVYDCPMTADQFERMVNGLAEGIAPAGQSPAVTVSRPQ